VNGEEYIVKGEKCKVSSVKEKIKNKKQYAVSEERMRIVVKKERMQIKFFYSS